MLSKVSGFVLSVVAFAALGVQGAFAAYPERQITIIVPFSAGGNTDIIARITAEHLSRELGQPIVIENRGGGGGTVGSGIAADATPDGYTLLFATAGSHSVNPNLRKITYDPIKDFDPISVAVQSSVLIVVHPSTGAKTLQDLIRITSGGKRLNFASGGIGTVAHVAGEIYNEMTGSSMVHVPYKGAGQALNDVVAGRVPVYMNNIPSFLVHVRSGKLNALAVAAGRRSNLLPDVPTTAEAGLPGLKMGSWYGLVAPRGIPDEARMRLHAAMKTVLSDEAVKQRFEAIGTEAEASESPEAFRAFMVEQLAWWAKVLDDPKFKKK